MELKPGFKQTEVGVIPEDWVVLALGHIIGYTKGFAFSADDYQSHGIRIIRVSDTMYDGIKDEEGIYIDETKAKGFLKWSVREGDLIVSTVGSKPPMYDSMVGKATFVQAKDSGALLNQNAVILRSRKWSLSSQRFLHNHLWQNRYLKHIEKIFRGNANQASITLKELFEYPIPLPPIQAEQEAIAEALSDADALIESMEQLIAKKRHLKQGAMQELLTGKKRLPGFSAKWEVKRLGDECELVTKGTTPTSIGKDFTDSGVKFIKVESLDSSGRIIDDKVAFIDEETNKLLKRSNLKEGDLLISIAGALGRAGIIEKNILPANTNQALAIARLKSDSSLNLMYVFYFLKIEKIKKHIEDISVQGAQANLSLQNIADLPIDAPDFAEQTAIAAILSDMDVEISALEAKLAKARHIKQGMMQELLTGRIRLV